ncbi:MAG: hypothetical protein IJA10_03435 [Lachnospiraceae bacterium]|nr:hypothetical protein [Lachnospiraceae bacterium]
MKKKKMVIRIVVGFIVMFTILVVISSNSAKKENELAKSIVENGIVVSKTLDEYSEMTKDERDTSCMNKHIEITGTVSEVTDLYIIMHTDGFEVKCYIENMAEPVIENAMVTIDGACIYNADDNMRLRICTVTKVTKTDDKKSEVTSEESSDESTKTNAQEEEKETISGDENLEIVNKILLDKGETRKVDNIVLVNDCIVNINDKLNTFSVPYVSYSLYGCSTELKQKQEELKEKLGTISDFGAIIYLEGTELPEYYVDFENEKLYSMYSSEVGASYWLLDVDNETIKNELCEFYNEMTEEVGNQISKYEYEVNGTVVERDLKIGYVIVRGTACNGFQEQFEGYIRINYDDEQKFASDSISVTAYGLEPDDSRKCEYGNQKCLFLETDSVYQYAKETWIDVQRAAMVIFPNEEW